MPVTSGDLQTLNELCNTICYHLTSHLAAVAAGKEPTGPAEVSQIYQLASRLPRPGIGKWGAVSGKRAAGGAGGAGTPHAPGAKLDGKRMRWTQESEGELVELVENEAARADKLGKEGTRGGKVNWAAVARHFGFSGTGSVKHKYAELKGTLPSKKGDGEEEEEEEDEEEEKPAAKKAKGSGGAAPAAGGEPAGGGGDGHHAKLTKAQEAELVKLVEDEAARKAAFDKRKLRWKRIAEHFGVKTRAARKHYTKATGKAPPEDDD